MVKKIEKSRKFWGRKYDFVKCTQWGDTFYGVITDNKVKKNWKGNDSCEVYDCTNHHHASIELINISNVFGKESELIIPETNQKKNLDIICHKYHKLGRALQLIKKTDIENTTNQNSDNGFHIGQIVEMRDDGESWSKGIVTKLSPLNINGYSWDQVRPDSKYTKNSKKNLKKKTPPRKKSLSPKKKSPPKNPEYNVDIGICTNKTRKLLLDPFLNTQNTEEPEKLILLHDNSCFDIDELARHIISRDGYNIHPYSTPGLKEELTWLNEDQLIFIINHPHMDPALKEELIAKTEYVFNFDERLLEFIINHPEILKIIGETGLCLLSDYTKEYKPGTECLAKLQKVILETGYLDELLNLRNFRGKSLSSILESSKDTCLHGIGLSLSSIYCYNYKHILKLWNFKFNSSIEPYSFIRIISGEHLNTVLDNLCITTSKPLKSPIGNSYIVSCVCKSSMIKPRSNIKISIDINNIEFIKKSAIYSYPQNQPREISVESYIKDLENYREKVKLLQPKNQPWNTQGQLPTPYWINKNALLHQGYFPVNSQNFPVEGIDKFDMIVFGNKTYPHSGININVYSPMFTNLSNGGSGRIGVYKQGLYRCTDHYNFNKSTAMELINILIAGTQLHVPINAELINYYEARIDLGKETRNSDDFYIQYLKSLRNKDDNKSEINALTIKFENYIKELGYPQYQDIIKLTQCEELTYLDFNERIMSSIEEIDISFNETNKEILELISTYDKLPNDMYESYIKKNNDIYEMALGIYARLRAEHMILQEELHAQLGIIIENLPDELQDNGCIIKSQEAYRTRNIRLEKGEELCNARLWSGGCGLPCERKISTPNKHGLCNQHLDAKTLKYGLITKTRPVKFQWLPNSIYMQKERSMNGRIFVYPIFKESMQIKSKNKKQVKKKKICSLNKKHGICEIGIKGDDKCVYDSLTDSCKFSSKFLKRRQKDVVIVLQATKDPNRAFDKHGDAGLFTLIRKMEHFEFIYEKINTLDEAIHIITNLKKNQKIAHLIVMAHGNKDRLELSDGNYIDRHNVKHFADRLHSKLAPKASILLHSCLCGFGGMAVDNIANILAMFLPNHKIFASTKEINRGNLMVNKLENKVNERIIDGIYSIDPIRGYKIIEFLYNNKDAKEALTRYGISN